MPQRSRLLAVPALVAWCLACLAPVWAPAWAATPAPVTHAVSLSETAYTPPTLQITVGDTVSWSVPTSLAGGSHTVSSDQGLFGSGTLCTGLLCLGGTANYTHTFTSAGSFPYHCNFVPGMTGTIVVVAAPSPSPSPVPSPSPSPSPSPKVTATATPSPQVTATATPSGTATATPTFSLLPSGSPVPLQSVLGAPPAAAKKGKSAASVVALVAAGIAVVCAVGLLALRRSGGW